MRRSGLTGLYIVLVYVCLCSGPSESAAADTPESGATQEVSTSVLVEWIQEHVHGVTEELSVAAASRFLDDLKVRSPADFDRLTREGRWDIERRSSDLLRALAAAAVKPEWSARRPSWAQARVKALLQIRDGRTVEDEEAAALVAKLRTTSDVYHRRLLEGKMEDEDLWSLVQRVRTVRPSSAPKVDRQETAADILADYVRRAQEGSALSRVRSYTAEYELKTASGVTQRLVIARMRPDWVRMQVYTEGKLSIILAGSRGGFWQWSAGGEPRKMDVSAVPSRDFLLRFIDPLLGMEKAEPSRLADGESGGKPTARLGFGEGDAATIFSIDRESGALVGRVGADGTQVTYSGHEFVSGVRIPHREETRDSQGRTGVLTLKRFTPNPGLFSGFFELPIKSTITPFMLQSEWVASAGAKKPEGK